jgi:hypothetical protein
MDGWEYSVGGAKEVMFSLFMQWQVIRLWNLPDAQRLLGLTHLDGLAPFEAGEELREMRKIKIFTASGQELTLEVILRKLVTAINDLKSRDLPYDDLLGPISSIAMTPYRSPFWQQDHMVEHFGGEQAMDEYHFLLDELKATFDIHVLYTAS